MDAEKTIPRAAQPKLFYLPETSAGQLELFPAVWAATEGLTRPNREARRAALEELARLGAARFSPLVAYMLATRLADPEVEIRALAVGQCAELLTPTGPGETAPEAVLEVLVAYLSRMRTRQIYGLLQTLVAKPGLLKPITRLLDYSPYAGNHLADVVVSKRAPLSIRLHAVRLIGAVGYCDAIPALERMQARLEARLEGQQSMSFAPPSPGDESAKLLPEIRTALNILNAP